jgi:hypothetical protein
MGKSVPLYDQHTKPTETDPYLSEVAKRFHAMSFEERFEIYVRADIYSDKGELTEEYGGTAKPSPKRRKLPGEV